MAEESDHNSTMEAFETMMKDEQSRRFFELSPLEVAGSANDTVSSIVTTSDPLNTAFVGEIDNSEQCSQRSSSQQQQQQQQSQTTKETSSAIHHLIDTIVEQEHEIVSSCTPTKIIMTSTGTMPRTPIKMVSVGTMPKTPTMKAMGTMSITPATIDLVSPSIETIDLCSPDTPTNTESSPSNSTPYMPPPPPQ